MHRLALHAGTQFYLKAQIYSKQTFIVASCLAF